MPAQCGKGWTERCAHAKSKKCSCRCGGANHGKALRKEESSAQAEIDAFNSIYEMAGELPRYRDSEFEFTDHLGRYAVTHLTVWNKVVIATERDDNPGASITNAAEQLWAQVRANFTDDIIAIEHYPKRGGFPEDWDLVTIVNGDAQWSSLTREAVADLIAGRLLPCSATGWQRGQDHDKLLEAAEADIDISEESIEGRVFYPGDEVALNRAIDAHVTRTPA